MSKHICFFIGSISNGAGTERITISLANLFVKRGYRVSVVSLCQSDPPFFSVHREINTYCIFTKPCAFTLYFFQLSYLQPIITQYFIDNKSEIWLLFLIAHSKR